jgi:hypothetical protein
MNKEQLKSYLIRDKGFLKKLYEGPDPLKNKKVLTTAEDSELNTLIKYLHFLANGEIKMKKESFQIIQESHKLKFLQKGVEKKTKVHSLLKEPRAAKLKFLCQLVRIYSPLLYPLFNEQ